MRILVLAWPSVSLGAVAVAAIAFMSCYQADESRDDERQDSSGVTLERGDHDYVASECYRGHLTEGQEPDVWLPHYEQIAVVTAHDAEGEVGPELGQDIRQVHTAVSVTFEEWIKGSGAKEGVVSFWGEVLPDGTRTTTSCNDMLMAGDRAVVFVNPNPVLPGEGSLGIAYVFDGEMASSVIDGRSLPVDELTAMLREAATDPGNAATGGGEMIEIHRPSERQPLAFGHQPTVHVAKVPVVALVTVESASEPQWDTSLAELTGSSDARLIYTLMESAVVDYIKGGGPDKITIRTPSGEIDGWRMVNDGGPRLEVGDTAAVFLDDSGQAPGWRLVNSYTVRGDVAYSIPDDRTLDTEDLIKMLRQEADTPD